MGTVAARYKENGQLSNVLPSLDESQHRLAVVAGTSTCHIVQSPEGVFVNGVWGPYKVRFLNYFWSVEYLAITVCNIIGRRVSRMVDERRRTVFHRPSTPLDASSN